MNKGNGILILLLIGSVKSCERQEAAAYMDVAVEMMKNLKLKLQEAERNWCEIHQGPMDCADLLRMGFIKSGRYKISPVSRILSQESILVYCDMDTDGGGWTVMQRRGNFNRSEDYFYQDWNTYKKGFGNIDEEFWLGNNNIFALTNQKQCTVRFDLVNSKLEKRYAQYDYFWIDDELHNFSLHVSGYKGDAGDSFIHHNEAPFSTRDRDNDKTNIPCSDQFKSGWWFTNCYTVNLNGPYFGDPDLKTGIHWNLLTGYEESLTSTEIKIRPQTFKLK